MAESENGAYKPGTYVKGDAKRAARTPAEAVDLVWKGFVREPDSKPEAPVAEEAPAETGTPEVAEPTAEAKRGPGRPRKDAEDTK